MAKLDGQTTRAFVVRFVRETTCLIKRLLNRFLRVTVVDRFECYYLVPGERFDGWRLHRIESVCITIPT